MSKRRKSIESSSSSDDSDDGDSMDDGTVPPRSSSSSQRLRLADTPQPPPNARHTVSSRINELTDDVIRLLVGHVTPPPPNADANADANASEEGESSTSSAERGRFMRVPHLVTMDVIGRGDVGFNDYQYDITDQWSLDLFLKDMQVGNFATGESGLTIATDGLIPSMASIAASAIYNDILTFKNLRDPRIFDGLQAFQHTRVLTIEDCDFGKTTIVLPHIDYLRELRIINCGPETRFVLDGLFVEPKNYDIIVIDESIVTMERTLRRITTSIKLIKIIRAPFDFLHGIEDAVVQDLHLVQLDLRHDNNRINIPLLKLAELFYEPAHTQTENGMIVTFAKAITITNPSRAMIYASECTDLIIIMKKNNIFINGDFPVLHRLQIATNDVPELILMHPRLIINTSHFVAPTLEELKADNTIYILADNTIPPAERRWVTPILAKMDNVVAMSVAKVMFFPSVDLFNILRLKMGTRINVLRELSLIITENDIINNKLAEFHGSDILETNLTVVHLILQTHQPAHALQQFQGTYPNVQLLRITGNFAIDDLPYLPRIFPNLTRIVMHNTIILSPQQVADTLTSIYPKLILLTMKMRYNKSQPKPPNPINHPTLTFVLSCITPSSSHLNRSPTPSPPSIQNSSSSP
jgi:hypothetical protein